MGVADDAKALFELLETHRIDHMLVGALALDALAIPRGTIDIDIQVRLDEPLPSPGRSFHGWWVEERAHDEVFDQDTVILVQPGHPRPFELFQTTHWLPQQALDRKQTLPSQLLQREVPVPRPEDFILLKAAYWLHEARSDAKAAQDAVDIEAVADTHEATLDLAYIQNNAQRLGVHQDLSELLPALH